MLVNGFTIHEGYNDLGTFEIDITEVEQNSGEGKIQIPSDVPVIPTTLLFKLEFLSGNPIPLDFRGVFTVKGRVEPERVNYEEFPNEDGFIQIDTPVFPVVVRKFEGDILDPIDVTVIRLSIDGELIERAEEMYIEVSGGGSSLYTLIWDLFITEGHLTIYDGDVTFYNLANDILVGEDITAIHITTLGVVYGYDSALEDWDELGTLEFTMIEFPENLTSFSDGFYQTTGTTGSLTQGELGTGDFALYTSTVLNPEPYLVNVTLNVYGGGEIVFTDDFLNLMPGDVNYIPVVIDGIAPVPADTSPTITEVQTISGITFSAEFLAFLATKELGTVDAVRKAGPITYIEDFPSEDVGLEELNALQAHTDLYMVNQDAEQNQHIIEEGYGKIYDIANTPKDVFVTDVVYAGLSLFRAAQIHEVVTQNQKLVSNMLAGTLNDLRLATPAIPPVEGSTFRSVLSTVASSCGCDDCKSGISPFAYLMDLLKYGATHIDNSPYVHGGTQLHLEDFVDMVETKFRQPFGELNVSCETLHDEFCRVRLVTEVLESLVTATYPVEPSSLTHERIQFLLLVYKTILLQAGTSINELRNVVVMPSGDEKSKAVQKLSDKLNLPIYVPSTATLSVHAIWLTIGNTNPSNELTAVNLEALFGFRDTQRDVLTVTPVADIVDWRDAYLRDVWRKQDYPFSAYSREDVVQGSSGTYKANWQPIVDPDNIGWEDMTYLTGTDTKLLWLHRRADTDSFINNYFSSPPLTAIDADINARIVRAAGVNISNDVMEDDTIQLYDPTGLTWVDFEVLTKKLATSNTDVILKKSTAAVSQPALFQAGYPTSQLLRQEVSMDGLTTPFPTVTSTVQFTLTFSSETFFNPDTYLKIRSVGASTYEYETGALPGITGVTFEPDKKTIKITITDAGGVPASFDNGVITLTYERVVPYMLYNQVVTMSDFSGPFPSVSDGSPFTITFNNELFFNQTGKLKIKSITNTGTSIYSTGVSPGIDDVSFDADHKSVTLTINDASLPANFDTGAITLYYEKNIALNVDSVIVPEDFVTGLFADTLVYTLLDATTVNYKVWNNVSIPWPPTITASTPYGKIKQMQQLLAAGEDITTFTLIVNDYLHTTVAAFNRFMEILVSCENYLNSMYSVIKPTTDDIYEMLSIIRACAKKVLKATWVAEEIEYGTDPIELSGQLYWKAIVEPIAGKWDPSLQTDVIGIPIIDPELLSRNEMLSTPESQIYIDLYDNRVTQLSGKFDEYIGYINSADDDAFKKMLNDVANDSTAADYSIAPYTSLTSLLNDLTGNDVFKQKYASDILKTTFSLSSDDFIKLMPVITPYESNDAQLTPAYIDLQKATRILVSAYKRNILYSIPTFGWLDVEATYDSGNPIMYYNAIKMKMAPGRTDSSVRSEWQQTLAAWNRLPFIQPDIVPPENIINFITTNPVYTIWNARNIDLLDAYTDAAFYINSGVGNANDLLLNLQGQIDLIVGRLDTYTILTPPFIYYPFFETLKDKETLGIDIRPFVKQLGLTMTEYRYLANIVKVLEVAGVAAIPLIDSEYDDVINILIAIHSRNLTFDDVVDEYDDDILLSPDYFQIYKQPLSSFPLTNLPIYNAWRSPLGLRNDWENILEGRIDREAEVEERWKKVLEEAEDQNMPLMRDALIRVLTPTCVDWHVTAEKLARSYFIETKDNCCVKHTRVSFALETLQGFYFALENGIFDDYVAGCTLIAPQFKQEWEWLGTYSAWRSAMFVFIYPENLLYPTLKRKQSPAFIGLSQTLQNANRFSPEDACDEAKKFDTYIQDIQHLETVCSTTAETLLRDNEKDCCVDIVNNPQSVTFFFAQSKLSGKCYSMSAKTDPNTFIADDPGFWEELPIKRKKVKLLAAFALGNRYTQDWSTAVYNLALYAFYSFFEDGKLKLAYLKKDLSTYNSGWSDEEEVDDVPDYVGLKAESIFPCQHTADWLRPGFIISYKDVTVPKVYNIAAEFSKEDNKLTLGYVYAGPYGAGSNGPNGSLNLPTFAIRTFLTKPSNSTLYNCIAMFYGNRLFVFGFNFNSTFFDTAANTVINPPANKKVIGMFESRSEENTIIMVYTGTNNSIKSYEKILLTYSINSANSVIISIVSRTALTGSGSFASRVTGVLPIYTQKRQWPAFAVKANFTDDAVGCYISNAAASSTLTITKAFYLSPKNITDVPLQSADCILDMTARANKIKSKINGNTLPDSPTIPINYPTKMLDVLYEAYYFVPMLLALDQQKRGQYESALAWYRSVYDYTSNVLTNRKIFYGLVKEELIISSYTQNANWLLDPLNPHLIAQTRTNAFTKYTVMNIIQCLYAFADREFTMDTAETVPIARKLYSVALDLLKIKELALAPNLCEANSINCLSTLVTTVTPNSTWSTQLARLQQNLERVRDPELIDTLAEDIAVLLNAADEDTFPEKFADAFELIDTNLPPAPEPETVTTVLGDSTERFNDTLRYIFATSSQTNFIGQVENNYARAVAGISGIDVGDLETVAGTSQIAWLSNAPPSNGDAMNFQFATIGGVQLMPGSNAYNPIKPSPRTYTSNLLYYNAPFVIGAYQNNMPVGYTPLMDFKFCMPQNPVYEALNMKGNLELYKIFNCRNIAGMIRELSVYSAATDTVSGMPIIGASGNLFTPGVSSYSPSQYRFRVLIERAKQIAAQAQQMESMFLAALEKEDAENYSQLKARQDIETARATVKLQDLRITQANDEKVIADLQLNKATFVRDHYQNLYDGGINAYEIASLLFLEAAGLSNLSSAAAFLATTALGNVSGGASALTALAAALSTQSSAFAQLASFQRRQEEWAFQKDTANFDVSISNQQIKVASDNIRIVTQERDIAQLNTDHAQASLDFLKNKFTNAELYNWMGNVLQSSYSYMLNLSTSIARTAEKQLFFERQAQAGPFILSDYWETPSSGFTSGSSGSSVDRRGLTGSARLLVDVTKLDQYAFDTNKRKLQMTKVISLSQNFPSEFQQFKETGVFNFSLTNQMFDYDFPGNYLRLINSVKTTVVGLLPVYDQVKATLTADTISYTVIGGTTFQKIPIRRLELDSVALTSANNATGLFEMQPAQSELLNPFEGMGLESRWEFKMPQFSNRFDFNNIADVLLTVEYTALDDFQYRTQVIQELENELSFNRGFSFKNNFPDQWYELAETEINSSPTATIELKREMFPQGIDNLKLSGTDILLYFVRKDYTGEINITSFNLPNGNVPFDGSTNNGLFRASALTSNLGNANPVFKLKLVLDPDTVPLFNDENITDIILLLGCKADLKNYPL